MSKDGDKQPIIDMEMAMPQVDDDYEFLEELIQDFLTDFASRKEKMANAVKKIRILGDYKALEADLKGVFEKCSSGGVVNSDALANFSGGDKGVVENEAKQMDMDGDGKITFPDMVAWWSRCGQFGGLKDFVTKTSSGFTADSKSHLAEAAEKKKTFEAIRSDAHAVKGSALNLGLCRVSSVARLLEFSAKEALFEKKDGKDEIAKIMELVDGLATVAKQVEDEYQSILLDHQDNNV